MTNAPFRCPLCDGAHHELLQRQSGLRMVAAAVDESVDVDTHLCLGCGIVLTHPQPEPALLDRFYATQHRDLFVADRPDRPDRPDQLDRPDPAGRPGAAPAPGAGSRRDQARWLEEQLGPLAGRRILEVGCYDGYLLHLLAERGASVAGVEPSAAAAAHARERYGLDVRACALEQAQLAPGSFDVVVLSHVLEHLRDPRAALARCRALLVPGGAVFIEVPNVLRPRIESAVDFFTFDHLFHFSPRTLGRLGARCGLETRRIDEDFPFPAFRWIGEAVGAHSEAAMARDAAQDRVAVAESRAAVQLYRERRRAFVTRLRERLAGPIAEWRARAASVVVYGAGSHTEYLLQETDLGLAPIVAFVDGNPGRQGQPLHGRPVLAPERLRELAPEAIVISSYDFQDEMAANARRLAPAGTRIVTCYEHTPAFSNFAGRDGARA